MATKIQQKEEAKNEIQEEIEWKKACEAELNFQKAVEMATGALPVSEEDFKFMKKWLL